MNAKLKKMTTEALVELCCQLCVLRTTKANWRKHAVICVLESRLSSVQFGELCGKLSTMMA